LTAAKGDAQGSRAAHAKLSFNPRNNVASHVNFQTSQGLIA
jgi:hypothetical protein